MSHSRCIPDMIRNTWRDVSQALSLVALAPGPRNGRPRIDVSPLCGAAPYYSWRFRRVLGGVVDGVNLGVAWLVVV